VKRKGFTLVEVMIVVAIIAALMAIAIPNYRRIQEQGNIAKAKSELRTLQTAVENYYIHNSSTYPAALSDLTTAIPRIVSSIPDDVFAASGSYGYVRGGTSNYYYVIYSVGPDGNGSATISSDAVSETNGSSCIYVSNAGDDSAP
jgi:prepilin-type N-terminal cleavage/methylation domain-containing protein